MTAGQLQAASDVLATAGAGTAVLAVVVAHVALIAYRAGHRHGWSDARDAARRDAARDRAGVS